MEIDLDDSGNPVSPFFAACSTRAIDLGKSNEPHPHQLIPARWRSTGKALTDFADELEAVELRQKTDGSALLSAYQHLVYEATELFDCYTLMLPDRIHPNGRAEKNALKEFRDAAKRLRAFTANVCNRCKHQGAQLKFLWATSPSNGRTGARLLVNVYRDGDSLVRDDAVHRGRMAGMGMVRIGHELVHALLRVDRAAGRLVAKLGDGPGAPMQARSFAIPIGDAARRIAALRATRHDDEPALHDGVVFEPGMARLERVAADSFGPRSDITAALTVESGTTTYSLA
ncbi:hypothetical protein [Sphingomonas oryzagri]|uniref:Uncharacterized protein n=1 Tax=Sphingomonas oryzagri TaxID=3042314 RepID=A0ABT6N3X2_9SPHN|nr:hypothetical protein [Sphingomonas oryzagri]MDH7639989.1 hypothetical protein [Sphingomonas oryzagri]